MQNEATNEERRATETTTEIENAPTEQIAIDPLCTGRCSVCDSGYADVINGLRNKYTLRGLSEYLQGEYSLSLSKDALHLHFQKYAIKLRNESSRKAYMLFKEESSTLATHQKQTLFLASYTFEEILRRIDNGTLTLGVEDFEKMMKLYYQILRDPDGAVAPDAMEVYMRAWKYYKVPIAQGSLPLAGDVRQDTPPKEAP